MDLKLGTSTITWSTAAACGDAVECMTLVTINEQPVMELVEAVCSADLTTYDV